MNYIWIFTQGSCFEPLNKRQIIDTFFDKEEAIEYVQEVMWEDGYERRKPDINYDNTIRWYNPYCDYDEYELTRITVKEYNELHI